MGDQDIRITNATEHHRSHEGVVLDVMIRQDEAESSMGQIQNTMLSKQTSPLSSTYWVRHQDSKDFACVGISCGRTGVCSVRESQDEEAA